MARHLGAHDSSQSRRSRLFPSRFLTAVASGSGRRRAERRRNRRGPAMATEQLEPRALLAVTPTLTDTAYAVTGPGVDTVGRTWAIPSQDFAFIDTNQGLLKFSAAGLNVGGWSSPIPLNANGFQTEIKDIVFGTPNGTPFADGSILVYGKTTEGVGREWMRLPGYDTSYGGGGDGFVAKLRPNGSMVWGTYLGAAGSDSVDSVTVAPDGSIFVLGTTTSDRGFVGGGIDRVMDGGQDAFMVKLSSTGGHIWSTYLSPRGSDGVSQIFDTTGGFYVDVVPGGTAENYTIEAVVQSNGLKRIRMDKDGQLQQFPGIVSSIKVTNPGQDYTSAPTVSIGPPASGGRQATAEAVLAADGKVASIRITDRGEGYSSTTSTTVSIRGNGTNAAATATIANADYVRPVTAVSSTGAVVSLSASGGFLIRQGMRFPVGGTTSGAATKYLYAFTPSQASPPATGGGSAGPTTPPPGSIQKWDLGNFEKGQGDWSLEWALSLDGYAAKAFDVRDNIIYVAGESNDSTAVSSFNNVFPADETERVPGTPATPPTTGTGGSTGTTPAVPTQAILAQYRDRINTSGKQVQSPEWGGFIGGEESESGRQVIAFQDTVMLLGTTSHNRSSSPTTSWINRAVPTYRDGQEVFLARFSAQDPASAAVLGLTGPAGGTAVAIADGATTFAAATGTDFGKVALGAADVVRSFRIRNTGTGRLSISGLSVPSGFEVVSPPPATIEAGASADFSIQLRASATGIGVKQGTVQFSTNDATKPVYDFAIGGEVLAELVPEISVADVSVKEGDSGATNAAFVVSLSSSPTVSKPVSVAYSVVAGSATAARDYTAVSGTLTFAPGETQKTVTVPVIGDRTREANETLTLRFTNPTNATLAKADGLGTILDDDSAAAGGTPSIVLSELRVNEGNSGRPLATLTVSLSAAATKTVSVQYVTADGTAVAGSDYVRTPGLLTFAPGETSKTLQIPIVGDTTRELDETFRVNFSSPVNATLPVTSATVTIVNDDTATVTTPTVTIANSSIREGNTGRPTMLFTVALARAASSTLVFSYGTVDGTAKAGVDYVAPRTAATIVFAPGQRTATIAIPVIANTVRDGDRQFRLEVKSGGTTAASATGTIRDDETGSLSVQSQAFASLASFADTTVTNGSSTRPRII
jgi:hypothetical protein